jgi:putative flippase GtrA
VTAVLDLDERSVREEPLVAGRPGLLGRLSRCMGVSVVTTAISLSTIILATAVFGIAAAVANVLATSIATVPSYHLNRRWTWGRRDRSNPWREVLPFWILAFCGLALSTLTVGMADTWASHTHLSSTGHLATILVGHLGGFGVLWVLQFVLLDRVLFTTRTPGGSSGTGG